MLRLREAFKGHSIFLITHKIGYSVTINDIPKVYLIPYLVPTFQYRYISRLYYLVNIIINLIINMVIQTLAEFMILLKERPDIVISTGSGIAIPISYMAKLLGKKIIFVESLCRVSELSGSAKLIYPIVDLLLVQWESLLKKYPKARYAGNLI